MIAISRLRPIVAIAIGAVITYLVLTLAWHGYASAQAEAPPLPPATPNQPASFTELLTVLLLGAIAIFSGLRTILTFIAPRTNNTLDDRALALVTEIEARLKGPRGPVPLPVAPPAPVPARDPQAGYVNRYVMVVFAWIGIVVMALAVSCAGTRGRVATGSEAFIDCMAPDIADSLPDLVPLAKSALMRWIGGTGEVDASGIKDDMAKIKGNLGKCALATAIAVLSDPAPAGLSARASSGPQMGAAFQAARRELGWAPIHMANGVM